MIRTTARFAAVAALVLGLSACSLLKTPPPVQMYRFGSAPEASTGPSAGAPIDLAFNRVRFAEAVKEDRLLGVTGTQTAYIAGARWVSDADVLYADSLEAAFAAQAQRVRLVSRATAQTTQALDVEVRSFEARYPSEGATPTVVITAWVRLLDTQNRAIIGQRVFSVQQPAGENRVSAIVAAFDVATRDLNTQIVEWTDSSARVAAPARP